jgi:hypothetical protein
MGKTMKEWRKLHKEKLHSSYSRFITKGIKGRVLIWAKHVKRIEEIHTELRTENFWEYGT